MNAKTITLRTDDESLNLENVLTAITTQFPKVSISTWKKKGKHVNKKEKKTELLLENA